MTKGATNNPKGKEGAGENSRYNDNIDNSGSAALKVAGKSKWQGALSERIASRRWRENALAEFGALKETKAPSKPRGVPAPAEQTTGRNSQEKNGRSFPFPK
jgi:hypothetical protein